MRQDIKNRWVNALRSGKFKQGRKHLADVDSGTYCCLGVLCMLAEEEGVTSRRTRLSSDGTRTATVFGDFSVNWLPLEVATWAGLGDVNPGIDGTALSEYNDDLGATFEQIAALIQESDL